MRGLLFWIVFNSHHLFTYQFSKKSIMGMTKSFYHEINIEQLILYEELIANQVFMFLHVERGPKYELQFNFIPPKCNVLARLEEKLLHRSFCADRLGVPWIFMSYCNTVFFKSCDCSTNFIFFMSLPTDSLNLLCLISLHHPTSNNRGFFLWNHCCG